MGDFKRWGALYRGFFGGGKIWYNGVMKKHNRIIATVCIAGIVALLLMLNLTSPTEIGPFGVLLFFTILYVVVFCITTFFMKFFYGVALKRQNYRGKDYLYSAVASFGPVMILMAQSFGAITPWTLSLIGLFLVLTEFLVCKKVRG